jgi:DHA1 family bicyclomycin/chloramphenicol resistance-like MFS transporter
MAAGTVLNTAQALMLSPMVFTTVAPLVLYAIGIGIAMPAMTVLSLDCFPQNRGAASAVQGFIQMMGNALVASTAVPLLGHRPDWLALGQLSLIVVTLLLWVTLPAHSVE